MYRQLNISSSSIEHRHEPHMNGFHASSLHSINVPAQWRYGFVSFAGITEILFYSSYWLAFLNQFSPVQVLANQQMWLWWYADSIDSYDISCSILL